MLAGLLLLLLVLAAWLWARRRPRVHRWQAARQELDAAEARYAADGDGAALAASVSQLLRRAARLHNRTAVTDGGEPWQALLRDLAPDRPCADTLIALQMSMYRPDAGIDSATVLPAARRWLRRALLRRPRRV